MKCLECENMTCKQFFAKQDLWTGFCMNKSSPKYGSVVTGKDSCNLQTELFPGL